MGRDALLRLEPHSNLLLLSIVRRAVEHLAEVFGLSAKRRRSVTRAVDEALTNVMRHSYRGRLGASPPPCIFGKFSASPMAMVAARRLNEIRPGGLGLHFIRQAMDAVEYTRVGRINRLRLVKYLASHEGPPAVQASIESLFPMTAKE
jgi:serine/threonine-protein kinase RsbW